MNTGEYGLSGLQYPMTLLSTAVLREKWVGAYLDRTGKSYNGAFRLDFSESCQVNRVISSVAIVFSNHPILAAKFQLNTDDELIGHAPTKNDLKQAIVDKLSCYEVSNVTDDKFMDSVSVNPDTNGLRIAARKDSKGFHVWIGFWVFTLDGASIDILIREIRDQYLKKHYEVSKLEWNQYVEHVNQMVLDSRKIIDEYPVYTDNGPYGIDSLSSSRDQLLFLGVGHFHFEFPIYTEEIRKFCIIERVTPFALYFSAFQKSILDISGLEKVISGVPFNNRLTANVQEIVGPLSNAIPIATTAGTFSSFKDGTKQVQKELIKASQRQFLLPAQLLRKKGIHSKKGGDFPFPQLFNAYNSKFENRLLYLNKVDTFRISLLPNGSARVGFEITLSSNSQKYAGRCEFNSSRYSYEVAHEIVNCMGNELKKCL